MSASSKTLALLALAAVAMPERSALADIVGTAGAANTRSSGTPPGGATRVIEIGVQILRNEKIETSKSGSVQLIFIDKTSLTIGPNSSLVIDEFVFNPVDSTGHFGVSLARGVLRVVGGQASHSGGATVTTPVATLGIRGGIATVKHCIPHTVCAEPGTRAINHFGAMTINSGGVAQTVRMGFVASVGGPGQAPSPPVRVSSAETDGDIAATTSKPGQKGGTGKPPTDAVATRAGLGNVNAFVDSLTPPKAGPGAASRAAVAVATRPVATANLASQLRTTASLPRDDIPQVPTPLPAAAFLLTTTAGAGSSVPFLTASFATAGNVSISPVLGYRAGGSTTASPNNARIFQASLGVSGAGASQKSFLSVMTGVIVKTSQGTLQVGGFEATSPTSTGFTGSARRILASGAASSTTNPSAALSAINVDASLLPTGSFQTSQNALSIAASPDFVQATPRQASDNALNANNSTLYSFDQTVTRGATPTGLGDNRPTLTLNGFLGGIGATTINTPPDSTGNRGAAYIVTNLSGAPGDVSISLDATTSRLSAQFKAAGSGGPNTLATSNLRFGSTGATTLDGSRGTYVDLTNFAARSERTFSVAKNTTTVAETSTINGQTLENNEMILVNANSVNAAALFPATTFCACTYTQWGFWSVAGNRTDATSRYLDRTSIATWVAGVPSSAADVQNAITANTQATYGGHAIATISNNGAQYLAASNFTAAVNFGTRSAVVSIPNLDGYAYSGTRNNVAANAAGAFVTTIAGIPVAGAGGATSMLMTGSFFQSPTDRIGEIGGNLAITHSANPNYLGAGIFAGARRP